MILMLAIIVPTWVAVLALVALVFFASSLFGGLLGPMPRYRMMNADEMPPNDSDRFLEVVEALADAGLNRAGDLTRLPTALLLPGRAGGDSQRDAERESGSLHFRKR